MQDIRIVTAESGKRLKQFIYLPRDLYAKDKFWVPPLWILEKRDYNPGNNSVLARSDYILLLALKGEEPAGRILAYIDPRHNDFLKVKRGLFGSFESADDEVGDLLLQKAEEWLKERGMTEILGPINPVAESWGFLLEGSTPPVFMSPHNPLFYNRVMDRRGYGKAKDLLVSEADAGKGYAIPRRFSDFADKILDRKKQLRVRCIDRKHLHRDALHILNILNRGVAGNWGFIPVEEDEMVEIVNKLKLILDEKAIWFVEDRGVPVGVALGFPDINVVIKKIKGRLTPPNIITLMRERRKIRDYRLWGLAVLPEYHGLGLDVLLYVSLARALQPRGIRLEANYMLEDNPHILNALTKMGLQQIKKYRIYRRDL